MMTYEIRLDRQVSKQLAKLDKSISRRIYAKIYELANNPRPSQAKKLVGRGEWRLRVGDYRVIYDIRDKEVIVWVVKVSHRKDVYR